MSKSRQKYWSKYSIKKVLSAFVFCIDSTNYELEIMLWFSQITSALNTLKFDKINKDYEFNSSRSSRDLRIWFTLYAAQWFIKQKSLTSHVLIDYEEVLK